MLCSDHPAPVIHMRCLIRLLHLPNPEPFLFLSCLFLVLICLSFLLFLFDLFSPFIVVVVVVRSSGISGLPKFPPFPSSHSFSADSSKPVTLAAALLGRR